MSDTTTSSDAFGMTSPLNSGKKVVIKAVLSATAIIGTDIIPYISAFISNRLFKRQYQQSAVADVRSNVCANIGGCCLKY